MSIQAEQQLTQVVKQAMDDFERTVTQNFPQAAAHLLDAKNVAQKQKFEDSVKGAIRMSLWLDGQ